MSVACPWLLMLDQVPIKPCGHGEVTFLLCVQVWSGQIDCCSHHDMWMNCHHCIMSKYCHNSLMLKLTASSSTSSHHSDVSLCFQLSSLNKTEGWFLTVSNQLISLQQTKDQLTSNDACCCTHSLTDCMSC